MRAKLALLITSGLLLAGCSLPNFLKSKFAALQVSSSPTADVYINDEKVGETPFTNQKIKADDYIIRLSPKEEGFSDWETSVSLQPNITTVIKYDFSQQKQQSSGQILTLEPIANESESEISVVSIPDNASVKLDGQPKGFTPLQIKGVAPGDHTLLITAPGYKQRKIEIKTVAGHRLTADIQLAKESLEESTASAEPKAEEDEKPEPTKAAAKKEASPSAELERPYVEILDTPTGWLRVRSAPTTSEDNEIAKVSPGETYSFIESNESGWYKISLTDGSDGWISGRYAKLYK